MEINIKIKNKMWYNWADTKYQLNFVKGVFEVNKIVEELKNVGTFYIATVENDQPRVRPFSSVTEFEGNIYLCTRKSKRSL